MMKKKSILMLIAAGAVLCAVICAAGCISSDEDDDAALIGTWYHGDDSFEAILTLAEDNTGVYCLIKDDDGKTGVSGPFPHLNFVLWDADGDKFALLCDDGRTITGTVNEKDGSLMTDRLGIGYEPVALADDDADAEYIWYYEDESYAEVSVDLEDGTGYYYALEFKADKNVDPADQFTGSADIYTWVPDGEGHEITTCSDGSVSHNTYDKDHTTLTSDRRGGMVYEGMPDTFTAFLSMLAWAEKQVADSKTV